MKSNFEQWCPEARELLQEIYECEFTLVDINLYLDTHPEDERALADYNCYAHQLRTLKKTFVREFGPFENFGNSTSEDYFKWVSQTWPWQTVREV